MFVHLTPNKKQLKEWKKVIDKCKKEWGGDIWDKEKPIVDKELEGYTGIYVGSEHELYTSNEFAGISPAYEDSFNFFIYESKFKIQYGVADTPEQIIKYYQREFDDPSRKFIVLVYGLDVEEAERNEKFYKNGPYIGNCKDGRKRTDDYNPAKITEEVENNGYLIAFHIYPLPGTEPYPSKRYQILKKYVANNKPFVHKEMQIDILGHDSGEFWKRNGDVAVRINVGGSITEETMTTYSLVNRIYNEIYIRK